jgi:hypothetical protein
LLPNRIVSFFCPILEEMAESAAITTRAPESFYKWPLSQNGNLFHDRAEQPNKEFQIQLFLLFDGAYDLW